MKVEPKFKSRDILSLKNNNYRKSKVISTLDSFEAQSFCLKHFSISQMGKEIV